MLRCWIRQRQFFTHGGREDLRIGDATDRMLAIEDHGGRNHRARERAAAGLVDACREAGLAQIETGLLRIGAPHRVPLRWFRNSRMASAARALASRRSVACIAVNVATSSA